MVLPQECRNKKYIALSGKTAILFAFYEKMVI